MFVTSNGPLVAASRTRVFQYLPLLRAKGVEAAVHVVVPDRLFVRGAAGGRGARWAYYLAAVGGALRAAARILCGCSRFDVVFLQRVLLPPPFSLLLRRRRQKVVFDFDDAIYTTEDPKEGLTGRVRAWFHRASVPMVLRAACRAVVENAHTAAFAERCGARVTVITGPIDTGRYRPGPARKEGPVVLGWIGSPSTARYLDLLRGPLEEVARRRQDLCVRIVGVQGFGVDGLDVACLPWALETEVAELQLFDIGLMPLPDDPWTRGKGGYKILQYGAVGIPVVASPTGVNRVLVDHGRTGLLATSAAEWVTFLETLVADPAMRAAMGQAGRRKMETDYSLSGASSRLLEALVEVGTGRHSAAGGPAQAASGRRCSR